MRDGGVSQWDFPMEIKGPSRIETTAIKRKPATGGAAGGFSVAEHGDAHAQIVAGPGPIAALRFPVSPLLTWSSREAR